MKLRALYLISIFGLFFLFCGPRTAETKKPIPSFKAKDFEIVTRLVDENYIDKNINKNRAFVDASIFALLSLPHPLYLYPEAYFKEREKFEDKESIYPGKTFKISSNDSYVIFDPNYAEVEKIRKARFKKNENKTLTDEEVKKVYEKDKTRKAILFSKWAETNFSKSDFEKVIRFIEENIQTYKTPIKIELEEVANINSEEEEENKDKEFTMDTVFLAASNGYLSSLDPHSNLFLREVWEESMSKINDSSFEGIGAILSGGGSKEVIVENPLEGSPAVAAGVRSGDVIQAVDNKSIKGMQLDKVVKKIKGTKGTTVVLTMKRKTSSTPIEISIVRDKITIKNLSEKLIKDHESYGYIKLTGFVTEGDNIQKALRDFEESFRKIENLAKEKGTPLKALVLDLRGNAGGYLKLAIGIADMFLPNGLIVSTKVPNQEAEESFASKPDLTKLPLMILINSKSASASEIVASALQQHGRALILGERSFGKATVQTLIPLPSNKEFFLKLTNARYYSPSGKTIQVVGVTPDIEVSEEPNGTFPFRFREEDMWNHLPEIPSDTGLKSKFKVKALKEWVKKNGKAEEYIKAHANDAIKPDIMLTRAVDYIDAMFKVK